MHNCDSQERRDTRQAQPSGDSMQWSAMQKPLVSVLPRPQLWLLSHAAVDNIFL
jgi:hypothetical protein